jgi:hypothetical protein
MRVLLASIGSGAGTCSPRREIGTDDLHARPEWAIQDSNLGPLPYQSHRGMERRDVRGHAEHKIPAFKRKWLIDPRRRLTPGLILMYPSGTSLTGDAYVISGDATTRPHPRDSAGVTSASAKTTAARPVRAGRRASSNHSLRRESGRPGAGEARRARWPRRWARWRTYNPASDWASGGPRTFGPASLASVLKHSPSACPRGAPRNARRALHGGRRRRGNEANTGMTISRVLPSVGSAPLYERE